MPEAAKLPDHNQYTMKADIRRNIWPTLKTFETAIMAFIENDQTAAKHHVTVAWNHVRDMCLPGTTYLEPDVDAGVRHMLNDLQSVIENGTIVPDDELKADAA